jgi:hypothetical protein
MRHVERVSVTSTGGPGRRHYPNRRILYPNRRILCRDLHRLLRKITHRFRWRTGGAIEVGSVV